VGVSTSAGPAPDGAARLRLGASRRDELVALLQALVRHPTEDPPGRELELARFVRGTLQAWGIDAVLDEFEPGRANVIARLRGSGERPALVFSAHLDTMPAGRGAWRHPPFEARFEQGRVYGRGAADMKSGLAAMMMAARALHEEAVPRAGDLILALSAGESSSCLGARRMVATGALDGAGALLIGEPSSLRVLVAEKGAWWVRVHAAGTPGHASGEAAADGPGGNAIMTLAQCLMRLRERPPAGGEHPLLGRPSWSVGTIAGGSAVNLTPDRAQMELDVRFLPGTEVADMRAALADTAGPRAQLETMDVKPPVETPAGHPFVQACLEACRRRLGETPAPGGAGYYSDACVLVPALALPRVIIGPGELGASGQRDEWVSVERLVAAADIYADIAVRCLSIPSKIP